jgi:hypothetical protein
MKDYAIALLPLTLPLWGYFFITKAVGVPGLVALILGTAVASGLLYNTENLRKLNVKTEWGEVLTEMREIKEDVYAKAESVQRMGEDIAVSMTYVLRGIGRFADEDQEYKLGLQREHLLDMLRKIGIEEQRSAQLVEPLTDTLRQDLADQALHSAHELLTERVGPITSKELGERLKAESDRLYALDGTLLGSPPGKAVDAMRGPLEAMGVWGPSVEAAIERFDQFRRTGKVTPKPTMATPEQ